MNYSMLEEAMEQVKLPVEVEAMSVYRAMEHIQDGRHKRGVRYSVALIFTLILLAKAAGMTTPLAIAQWVRLRAKWLSEVLPITRTSFPCAATYSNVLRAVDAAQVNTVLMQALTRVAATQRCGDEPSRLARQGQAEQHVALDGKTLRGTLGHEALDQRKMHQLVLYDTQTGLILKEQVTGEKQNELSIVSEFLTPVLVKGRIISADALHTQHAFCFTVTRWDGDYLLIAKDNQATLADDVRLFFTDPEARLPGLAHRTHGKLWPWTAGNPRTGGQYRTECVSGWSVGRRGPGVSSDAHGLRGWSDASGGRLWHHQPLTDARFCRPPLSAAACPLAD